MVVTGRIVIRLLPMLHAVQVLVEQIFGVRVTWGFLRTAWRRTGSAGRTPPPRSDRFISIAFNGMLKGPVRLGTSPGPAVRAGQTCAVERAICDMRNTAAHSIGHLTTRVEAAQTLNDLAAIINHASPSPEDGCTPLRNGAES
ncbi:hypothetical protein [Herbidospora mongoliensis]|uniref:hypothetical protein n=1 Tax=Herbidospora mongoliensis TaxID=688067 RepID=UPI0012F722C1|nr:hypothetical protein [Herbidospora mongoliensis]